MYMFTAFNLELSSHPGPHVVLSLMCPFSLPSACHLSPLYLLFACLASEQTKKSLLQHFNVHVTFYKLYVLKGVTVRSKRTTDIMVVPFRSNVSSVLSG